MPCLRADTSGGIYACNGHLPGSMGHWEQDAAVFAEWRLDMVKMDFVRDVSRGRFRSLCR